MDCSYFLKNFSTVNDYDTIRLQDMVNQFLATRRLPVGGICIGEEKDSFTRGITMLRLV